MTDTRSGFLAGLIEPNLVSVAVALGVAALCSAALFLGVDEKFAAAHLRYLTGGRRSHAVHTTAELLRLGHASTERPQVLVLGSSSIRNAVDVALLQELLDASGVAPVDVTGLSSGGQPVAVSRGIVERLPEGMRGVVVVGAGLRLFATPNDLDASLGVSPRLGVRSDAVDAAIRLAQAEPPSRIGNYVWDNRNFVVPRLLHNLPGNLIKGPGKHIAMPRRGRKRASEERYRRTLAKMRAWLADYESHVDWNHVQLRHLVEEVTAREGLEIVLVEPPMNPALTAEPEIAQMHRNSLARLEAIVWNRAPFLPLNETADLVEDDFLDATHLSAPGASRRYTTRLAEALIAMGGEDE